MEIQPHSREAEESLLGSILIDPDVLKSLTLSPGDFYIIRNRWVFEAARKLDAAGLALDYTTICDALERDGHLAEAGGPAFLTGLIASTPTSINAEHYAALVRDYAAKRAILALMGRGAGWAANGKTAAETAALVEQELSRISVDVGAKAHAITDASGAAQMVMDAVDRANAGESPAIPTGLADLDQLILGLFPQDLILVAARPGEGKTALLGTMLVNAAICAPKPRRVGMFTLEMPVTQIAMRVVSQLTGIPTYRLRAGKLADEEWSAYTHAIGQIAGAHLYFDDTPALTVTQMRQKLRRMVDMGVEMVLVDQLSNITPETRSEKTHEALNAIAYAVKNLAREFDVPIVMAHQMNRLSEHQIDPDPTLKDLADAGERAADCVIFIVNKKQNGQIISSRLQVVKQRNGPTGSVSVTYLPDRTRFENYTPLEAPAQIPPARTPRAARGARPSPADYEEPEGDIEP